MRLRINAIHLLGAGACVAALFVLAAMSMPLGAQWIRVSSEPIPRTPDGKPNLSAPAPWTVTQNMHLLPDTELEFIRDENGRDVEHLPGK